MKKIIFILLIVLFVSCKDNPTQSEKHEQIIFGGFAGYVGNEIYSHLYKIENGKLYYDTKHSYVNYQNPYSGNWKLTEDSLKKYFDEALLTIPDKLFLETDTVFGMPDAHDQGGLYLQIISKEGNIRYWLFDTYLERNPIYMKEYLEKLKLVSYKLSGW